MKNKPMARMMTISLCWLVMLFTTGCSRWMELVGVPDSAQDRRARMIARNEQVPLVVEHISLTKNGAPQSPSPETEQRLLGTLKSIGLFSRLDSTNASDPSPDDKVIRARVTFDEALDPHAGAAAWKGIVIGASMFLLAPVIQLDYDYAGHMTLELERWDGEVKRYESQSAGTVHYHLFGATPLMIDELRGHVTESCLTTLMHQLVHDTTFYTASSAPVLDRPIRSVSVKARKMEPSAVPISTTLSK